MMATKLSEMGAADMRAAMIDSQLRTNDVIDPAVIGAMGAVAREAHVPAALAGVAYMDRAIDLGAGRALNPPLVTGRLLVAADIRAGQRVLLIGAATGYTAALLARLGAEVHAVEEAADLLAAARAATPGATIHWTEGSLAAGAPKAAPFDRIIIDGAIEILPDALTAQLVEGGRIVAAQRDGSVTRLVQGVKTGGAVALRSFADMDVAPLPGFAAPKGFRF
jgi:protein-L-isoaspartate(D-aspartate) O-methyltransferase